MALRGKKPAMIEKRLKALFYGMSGVGKTTAAIQFPRPYLIDTEKGAENDQYVKILEDRGGAVFQTDDFEELIAEIKSLLIEKHDYKTLIIDPLTTLYNDLVEKSSEKLKRVSKEKDATGTEFGRHYGEANKQMKHLLKLLIRLDMNVIITSHAKNEYGGGMEVLGQTFDCYKKLDYLFDIVFEVQKRAKNRVGVVKKSRIEAFPDGDVFPFSYEEISNRYGKNILEKDAVQEVLATSEQLDELKHLIKLMHIPAETSDKWLTKAHAENFEEMPFENIQKCIEHLKSKMQIKGETA